MSAVLAAAPVERGVTPGRRAWRRLLRRRSAMAGLVIVVLFVLLAILAPMLAPYDPVATSWSDVRHPPSRLCKKPGAVDRKGSPFPKGRAYTA